jgi:hypothetical protein
VTAAASRLLPVPFIFLRHGETDWNTQNLAQGRTEVALNQRGLAQAAIAADALQNRGIVTIVASPLIRAKLTADIVAEKLGISVQLDNGLVECAYGEKEGLPMHDWFQHWVDGEYTPHGAESFLALRDRVAGAGFTGRNAANRQCSHTERRSPFLHAAHRWRGRLDHRKSAGSRRAGFLTDTFLTATVSCFSADTLLFMRRFPSFNGRYS